MRIIKKKFDDRSFYWKKDAMCNELFLNAQRNYFNEVLQHQGFVFLRDVYTAIGLETTKESCILGWGVWVEREKLDSGFKFIQINETPDFELIFECYPILDYLKTEGE